jgi:hypothetical protein
MRKTCGPDGGVRAQPLMMRPMAMSNAAFTPNKPEHDMCHTAGCEKVHYCHHLVPERAILREKLRRLLPANVFLTRFVTEKAVKPGVSFSVAR